MQIVRQGVSPYNTGGCYYGSRNFHDFVKGGPIPGLSWEMDEDTAFWWYNNNTCGATPVLTQHNCYFAYERNTTHIDKGCYWYNYHSSTWTSTAAVYSAQITEYYPGLTNTFAESERRECYSYDADACNWTSWNGY